jgi:hypothetical protein
MPRGTVVHYCVRPPDFLRTHEGITQRLLARAIAHLKGYDFAGYHDPDLPAAGGHHRFLVPDETLIGRERAATLHVRTLHDIFGGVVPHAFVRTKAITHPLVSARAARPPGWSDRFSARVSDAVLPGYTAFDRVDARAAAARLLTDGPVRVKRTTAAGGRGQWVATSPRDVDAALDEFEDTEIGEYGVVLEANLADVITYSVGHVTLDDVVVTYHGTQRETRDNSDRSVYGGSDLVVVRGGFDVLQRLPVAPQTRRAIALARTYDEAAHAELGVLASRRNYDVACGRDAKGRARSGVLEASWRIGGASGAELAAIARFRDDPGLSVLHASCVEAYGAGHEPPPRATIHFSGTDPAAGPMLCYAHVSSPSPAAA